MNKTQKEREEVIVCDTWNNNLPILGCPTCNTTAGRSVCRFHRDIVVNYSPSSSWNLPHDGKYTTMQDSFEYMTKNLVEEYVNQNGKKRDDYTFEEAKKIFGVK